MRMALSPTQARLRVLHLPICDAGTDLQTLQQHALREVRQRLDALQDAHCHEVVELFRKRTEDLMRGRSRRKARVMDCVRAAEERELSWLGT